MNIDTSYTCESMAIRESILSIARWLDGNSKIYITFLVFDSTL